MDAVLHVQAVLHHVGVGINHLVGILRQGAVVGLDHVGSPVPVVAGRPLRTVTGGATDFVEHLFAPLYDGVVEVAGTGHGQTAVPYHVLPEEAVAHLGLEVVVGIVELMGSGGEQGSHGFGNAGIGTVVVIGRVRIGLDLGNHVRVFRHGLCPGCRRVEVGTVAAAHVGNVPDGIGSGTVLQRGTGEGISEALDFLRAVGQGVPGRGGPVVGFLVPHGGIQFHVGRLAGILCFQRIIGNGV